MSVICVSRCLCMYICGVYVFSFVSVPTGATPSALLLTGAGSMEAQHVSQRCSRSV